MARPLPIHVKGPRRRRRAPAAKLLIACPRVDPEYELSALWALMKPQMKSRIEHRRGLQAVPRNAVAIVDEQLDIARKRLGTDAVLHTPAAGDFHFVIEVPPAQAEEAKAIALLLSRRLPDVWFTLDRLFIRGSRFLRRERGFKLNLVVASNVHLRRDIRAAVHDLLI